MRTPKTLLADVPNGTRRFWRAFGQRSNAAIAACSVELLGSIHLAQNKSLNSVGILVTPLQWGAGRDTDQTSNNPVSQEPCHAAEAYPRSLPLWWLPVRDSWTDR